MYFKINGMVVDFYFFRTRGSGRSVGRVKDGPGQGCKTKCAVTINYASTSAALVEFDVVACRS